MGFGAHSHDAEFPDDAWSLYQHVDLGASVALNTLLGGASSGDVAVRAPVAAVLRPHQRRLERRPWLASDAGEELLLVLRFTSPVHVRKILIVGGGGEGEQGGEEELAAHPSRLRCFVNRDEFDFDSVNDMEPAQEFDLAVNVKGTAELATRGSAFINVTTLALCFPDNHGHSPSTVLRYVGLQGDHTHLRREAVHANYEVLCQHDEESLNGHGHSHSHVHSHSGPYHGHSHGHDQ